MNAFIRFATAVGFTADVAGRRAFGNEVLTAWCLVRPAEGSTT